MFVRVVLLLGLALHAGFAFAQQPTRIAGSVQSFDGRRLIVTAAEFGTVTVEVADKAAIFDVRKATLADVKPGAFIGVGAMPQPDGSQRAIQVTVFAESQRGLSEGFRSWDRQPNSTMTNATVTETVASVDGQVLTVKYKGGEKRIVVPPEAAILAYSAGDRSELKPGAHVAILRAVKQEDGTLRADRINIGRGDVVPR